MATVKKEKSKGTLKAEEQVRRAKQLLAKEKAKDREKLRKEQNHHKYMMGGIIVKYFPACYQLDETQLNEILSTALASVECQRVIKKVEAENAGNGSLNDDDIEGDDDEE